MEIRQRLWFTIVMEEHPYTVCVDVEGMSDCVDTPYAELTSHVDDVDENAIGHQLRWGQLSRWPRSMH